MKNLRNLLKYLFVAAFASLLSVLGFNAILNNKNQSKLNYTYKEPVPVQLTQFNSNNQTSYPNLTEAAGKSFKP